MIPLQETRFWKNYSRYNTIVEKSSMRSTLDAIIYWKFLNYYKFKNFLEIGVYQGLTTGLFFESNSNALVDAVDPIDNLSLFREIYADFVPQLNFINKNSQEVKYSKSYDFILVDGDHSYEYVLADIQNIMQVADINTIIGFDDYKMSGVHSALHDFRKLYPDWVPFLEAEQTQFWHHRSDSRADFLDSLLIDNISKFVILENYNDKFDNIVCKARTISALTDELDLFHQCLLRYN